MTIRRTFTYQDQNAILSRQDLNAVSQFQIMAAVVEHREIVAADISFASWTIDNPFLINGEVINGATIN